MAVALVSTMVTVATTTKRAVDLLRGFQDLPEEGFFLWKLLDCLTEPLQLCLRLQRRFEAVRVVGPAVTLTQKTVARCEVVLARDTDEDDERPDSQVAWGRWLNHHKEGLTRRQALPELIQKLHICAQVLQLAIQTVQLQCPESRRGPKAPFLFLPEAVEEAHRIVLDFEFGRHSEFKLSVGSVCHLRRSHGGGADQTWVCCGLQLITLRWSESDKGFNLEFQRLRESDAEPPDDDGSDSDGENLVPAVSLSPGTTLSRLWGDSMELHEGCRLAVRPHDLVYVVNSSHCVTFGSVSGSSAEVMEAMLCLCIRKGRGPAQSLAEVVDLDRGVEEFKTFMESALGPWAQG
eukprot:RCo049637